MTPRSAPIGGGAGAARPAALLVVVAAILAGCLGEPTPSPAPTSTPTPEPTPVTVVYAPGVTIWYEGLEIHVDRVTATLDERGGPVEITLSIENPNDDASELDGPIRLAVGGTRVEPTRDSRVPTIPGLGGVTVALAYELQGISSLDAAVIEVGDAPLHVARVPVTPQAGTAATFEPIMLEVAGTATSSGLKVTLRGGLIRWDLPDWSQELDSGLAALTLTYDVTYAGDFAGGLAFTGENVALRLPDGTVVGPRRDGHSQSVELVGPRKTKKNLFSRFEIPNALAGEFALLVRNSGTERVIVFTVPG